MEHNITIYTPLNTSYIDMESDFGVSRLEAVKIAYNNMIPGFADGVCVYDYDRDTVYGVSYTSGTTENPANRMIPLYTISMNTEINIEDTEPCQNCQYSTGDHCIECELEAMEDWDFNDYTSIIWAVQDALIFENITYFNGSLFDALKILKQL